jgi:putative flippase GtrA
MSEGLAKPLTRFALVGVVGFVVDGTILTLLTSLAGWRPWHARIPAFLAAVLVTWLLNRRYTFGAARVQRRAVEAGLYLAIQFAGTCINLAIFGMCLAYFPLLYAIPVVALAIAAVAALIFNFSASHLLLYSQRRTRITAPIA